MNTVQQTRLIRYAITAPGLPGGAFFIDWPEGAAPPTVTASPTVVAENPVVPVPDEAIRVPPTITLPAYVGRKRPVTATLNGRPRKLSACVACLLAGHKQGEKLKARPETIRKWDAELPEFAGRCKVVSGKGQGGFVPVWLDGVEVG